MADNIEPGMKVRIVKDNGTRGMMIAYKYLSIREVGKEGTVLNWVPGHGGDVWFVRVRKSGISAYCISELEVIS